MAQVLHCGSGFRILGFICETEGIVEGGLAQDIQQRCMITGSMRKALHVWQNSSSGRQFHCDTRTEQVSHQHGIC